MKKILLILTLFMIVTFNAKAGNIEQIIAVVNDDVITSYDFYSRVNLDLENSSLEVNKDNINKVSNVVLQELIYERLKTQEAEKIGLSISKDELENAMSSLAKQNEMDIGIFKNRLSDRELDTLKERIKATLMWNKYIKRKIAPTINISSEEINEFMEKLENNKGKEKYLIKEIFYPVEDSSIENTVVSVMNQVYKQLESDPRSFTKVMQSFTENPNEGDLGWVMYDNLTLEIQTALDNMQVGDISGVIHTKEGYAIIKLEDKKEINSSSNAKEEEVRYKLMMEELNILQKRRLRDLRESAFIEVKK